MCSVSIVGKRYSILVLSKDHGLKMKIEWYSTWLRRTGLRSGLRLLSICQAELANSAEKGGTTI